KGSIRKTFTRPSTFAMKSLSFGGSASRSGYGIRGMGRVLCFVFPRLAEPAADRSGDEFNAAQLASGGRSGIGHQTEIWRPAQPRGAAGGRRRPFRAA